MNNAYENVNNSHDSYFASKHSTSYKIFRYFRECRPFHTLYVCNTHTQKKKLNKSNTGVEIIKFSQDESLNPSSKFHKSL